MLPRLDLPWRDLSWVSDCLNCKMFTFGRRGRRQKLSLAAASSQTERTQWQQWAGRQPSCQWGDWWHGQPPSGVRGRLLGLGWAGGLKNCDAVCRIRPSRFRCRLAEAVGRTDLRGLRAFGEEPSFGFRS